jgi:hypothetical protein
MAIPPVRQDRQKNNKLAIYNVVLITEIKYTPLLMKHIGHSTETLFQPTETHSQNLSAPILHKV